MRQDKHAHTKQISFYWLIPILGFVGLASYWLTISIIHQEETEVFPTRKPTAKLIKSIQKVSEPLRIKDRVSEITPELKISENALSKQRAITFKDSEAMQRFLEKMGNGISLLGSINSLDTLLVSFSDEATLAAMLDGTEETSEVFPVTIPSFEGPKAQAGAVALENGLLSWLGIEGDNSAFGKGIMIAVLDTGIADHLVFSSEIQRINLVPLPDNPAELNSHGTAVASLIFSNNPLAPGVAPGATPLSVRIADDNGSSNSFIMAQGIIAAVDAGAQLVNISLGGYGQSPLVDKALKYANDKGAIVVASAGNSGTQGVMQPAANPRVIAVGAVDAMNQPMAFSTTGSEVAISAPGYGVNVAYRGNYATRVNGTSFSGPIAAGVIAAAASSSGSQTMTMQQASNLVLSHLKDIGVQGSDHSTGAGVPDMKSILKAGSSGYYDASINSIYPLKDNQVGVLVQNLGTETLINAEVSISINGTPTLVNITTLPPQQTRLVAVPTGGSTDLQILSNVKLSSSQTDQRTSNNSLNQQMISK